MSSTTSPSFTHSASSTPSGPSVSTSGTAAAFPGPACRLIKLPWDVKEFDGSNASAYLRRFNLMATDCGLTGTAKLNRFSAYCTISIISEVESLAGYEDGDWDTFEGSLKKYYFDSDPQQKEYQIPYLRSLADHQRRIGAKDLKASATQYKKIARVLTREGKLSGYGACVEFYGGFPEVVQEDIQQHLNIDWTNPGALDVHNIIQEVIDLEDSKLERQRFLHSTRSVPSQSASAPELKTHVVPPQEIRPAPAPEEKLQLPEYGILPHSRTYYCLLFSLYHMFIIFVISY